MGADAIAPPDAGAPSSEAEDTARAAVATVDRSSVATTAPDILDVVTTTHDAPARGWLSDALAALDAEHAPDICPREMGADATATPLPDAVKVAATNADDAEATVIPFAEDENTTEPMTATADPETLEFAVELRAVAASKFKDCDTTGATPLDTNAEASSTFATEPVATPLPDADIVTGAREIDAEALARDEANPAPVAGESETATVATRTEDASMRVASGCVAIGAPPSMMKPR